MSCWNKIYFIIWVFPCGKGIISTFLTSFAVTQEWQSFNFLVTGLPWGESDAAGRKSLYDSARSPYYGLSPWQTGWQRDRQGERARVRKAAGSKSLWDFTNLLDQVTADRDGETETSCQSPKVGVRQPERKSGSWIVGQTVRFKNRQLERWWEMKMVLKAAV